MSCTLDVDRSLKADILSCSPEVRNQIGADLLALQDDPLPPDRADLDGPNAYYHRLPCGYYVSWELIGETADIGHLIGTGTCRNLTIRILGAGPDAPGWDAPRWGAPDVRTDRTRHRNRCSERQDLVETLPTSVRRASIALVQLEPGL